MVSTDKMLDDLQKKMQAVADKVLADSLATAETVRVQWGVLDKPSGVIDEFDDADEQTVRRLKHRRGVVVKRLVSDWQEVPDGD